VRPGQPSAELVQGGEAKLVRLLDEHYGGVRDIHAHFNNRRGQKNLRPIRAKVSHHCFLLRQAQPPMQQADPMRAKSARSFTFLHNRLDAGDVVALFHARVNDVSLASFRHFLANEFVNLGQLAGMAKKCPDPSASSRGLVDDGNVEIAIQGETECPRNRRGCHHQQMRIPTFADQFLALRHAELVLLVNDHQAEPFDGKARLDERVCPDEQTW
jgi:hypothetical protein